ncbi:NTP transferase domain-containing protein [Sulfolobus tengchongensis]|uniref:NTP transferase domain-containing protein n=1 Tax=Sulfolobus tengchongensis TaxID=207809 RepID=A0AAX4L060_9CREN
MKALILAGGKGKRISLFKPFLVVCGKPLISWVYESVSEIADDIYLGISSSHPLFQIFQNSVFKIFLTRDDGYESDIKYVVENLKPPILIVPVDIAYINSNVLKFLIDKCDTDICNLKGNSEYFGISYWTGLNFENYKDIVIEGGERLYNINTWEDYIKANKECNKR